MNGILYTLLSYLLLYKYVALFLVTFLSTFFLPLPSNTLLLATGAFASQGYFSLSISVLIALLGSVVGDMLGYTLMRIFGDRFVKVTSLKKIKYFSLVEKNMRLRPGLVIVVSRFLGFLDPLVNFMSGLAKIPARIFVPYDVLGNFLDVGLFIFVGYILGGFWESYSDILGYVGWIVVIIVAIYFIMRMILKRSHHVYPKI